MITAESIKKLDLTQKQQAKLLELHSYIKANNCYVSTSLKELGAYGICVKVPSGKYVILINPEHSINRQIATLEHELIHIKLGHLDERETLSNMTKELEVNVNMLRDLGMLDYFYIDTRLKEIRELAEAEQREHLEALQWEMQDLIDDHYLRLADNEIIVDDEINKAIKRRQ